MTVSVPDDMRSDTESMRSDTESMRSGPTSWAWSQDSADVETVIDAGRGRDSRFEGRPALTVGKAGGACGQLKLCCEPC